MKSIDSFTTFHSWTSETRSLILQLKPSFSLVTSTFLREKSELCLVKSSFEFDDLFRFLVKPLLYFHGFHHNYSCLKQQHVCRGFTSNLLVNMENSPCVADSASASPRTTMDPDRRTSANDGLWLVANLRLLGVDNYHGTDREISRYWLYINELNGWDFAMWHKWPES